MTTAALDGAAGDDAPAAPALPSRFWVYTVLFGSFFASSFLRPEMPGILLDLFDHSMSAAATYQGVCDAIGALLAFALVPWLGAVSDTSGRRTALIVTAVCSSANVLVLALSTALGFARGPTVWLFFAANTLSKVTTQSIAFSYVADVSTIERRSSVLLEAGALIYVFSAAGPFAAIALTAASDDGAAFDARSTAIALAALLALSSIVAAYLIPESKPPAKLHPHDGTAAERAHIAPAAGQGYGAVAVAAGAKSSPPPPIGGTKHAAASSGGGLVGVRFLLTSGANVRLVAAITLVSQVAIMGTGQVYYLYLTQDKGFERGDLAVCAILGSAFTCGMMFAQLWLSKRVPMSALMALSAASFTVYCCGLAFAAESKPQVYALIGFFGLAHVLYTNASALMAFLIPPNQLGLAMSALSGLKAFAGGVGPTSFALLFAHLVHTEPGQTEPPECLVSGLHCAAVPLVLGGAMALVAMVACVFLPVSVSNPGRKMAASEVRAQLAELKQSSQPNSPKSANGDAPVAPAGAPANGDAKQPVPVLDISKPTTAGVSRNAFAAARAMAVLKYRRALLKLMAAHRVAVAATAVPATEEYAFQPAHIAVAESDTTGVAAANAVPTPTEAAHHGSALSIKVEPTAAAAAPAAVIATKSEPRSADDPATPDDGVSAAVKSGAAADVATDTQEDAAEDRREHVAEWTALARWLSAADRGDTQRDPEVEPPSPRAASGGAANAFAAPKPVPPTPIPVPVLPEPLKAPAAVVGDAYFTATQRGLLVAALVAFIVCALSGVLALDRLFGPPTAIATGGSAHVTAAVATSSALYPAAETLALIGADASADAPAAAAATAFAAFASAAHAGNACARAAAAVADVRALRVVSLLGPPGVGKGALSRHILADFNTADSSAAKGKGKGKGKGGKSGGRRGDAKGDLSWPQRAVHISTGDLIRAEISAGSDIGRRVASIVRSGGLIDDDTVLALVTAKLSAIAAQNVALATAAEAPADGVCPVTALVILDGFPRRESQLQLWDAKAQAQAQAAALPPIRAAVSVTMAEDVLAERRSGRRICPVCGRTYNLHGITRAGYDLPARLPKYRNPDRCTADRTPLVPRPDDAPEVAAQRMAEWHADGPPLLAHFRAAQERGASALIEVDKTRSARALYVAHVQRRLQAAIDLSAV